MDNYNNQQADNQQYSQPYSQPYAQQQYGMMPKTGWNWGAFMLSWPFGFGNKTYLPLLSLLTIIPFIGWIFGIVWWFVCGACASGWAWKNGTYRTVAEFNAAMDSWNRAGLVMFIISLVLWAISAIFIVMFSAVIGAAIAGFVGSF